MNEFCVQFKGENRILRVNMDNLLARFCTIFSVFVSAAAVVDL